MNTAAFGMFLGLLVIFGFIGVMVYALVLKKREDRDKPHPREVVVTEVDYPSYGYGYGGPIYFRGHPFRGYAHR